MVNQGDIIFVDFAPTIGREQSGERPALVISNSKYNKQSGFVVACPITNTTKNMKVRIKLDERTKTQGDILCEQLRIIDLTARPYRIVEKLPSDKLQDVYNTVNALIIPQN